MNTTDRRGEALADDIVWGCTNIAAFLGKTERHTFYLLEQGLLYGAFKLGERQWGLSKSQARKGIEGAIEKLAAGPEKRAGSVEDHPHRRCRLRAKFALEAPPQQITIEINCDY